MPSELIEVMRDQVHTIYRALTGADLPAAEAEAAPDEAPIDELARRFVELETLARSLPSVSERIPPFSFVPPLNTLSEGDGLVVELAVPGVDRDEVAIETSDDLLIVSGIRRGAVAAGGHDYAHAEIPRGPFYRAIQVPFEPAADPQVDLDRGLLRIHLKRASESQSRRQQREHSTGNGHEH